MEIQVDLGHISINANKTTWSAEIPCHLNAALMVLVRSTYQLAGQQKPSLVLLHPLSYSHTLLDAWSLLTCSLFIPFSSVTMGGGGRSGEGNTLQPFCCLTVVFQSFRKGRWANVFSLFQIHKGPALYRNPWSAEAWQTRPANRESPPSGPFLCWKLQQKS